MESNIPNVYWIANDRHANYRVIISWLEKGNNTFEMLSYVGLFEDLNDAVRHIKCIKKAIEKLAEQKPTWKTNTLLHHILNFDYWNWYQTNDPYRKAVTKMPEYTIPSTNRVIK